MRFEILRRDNFRCVYCGATAETAQLVVDHIEPYSKGGPDTVDNYATACHSCNSGKSDRVILSVEVFGYPEDSVEASIANHIEIYFHHDQAAYVRCVLEVMREYPMPDPSGTDIDEELIEMSGGHIWGDWENWCILEGGRRHRLEVLKGYEIDPDAKDGWGYPMPPAEAMPAWMLAYYLKGGGE